MPVPLSSLDRPRALQPSFHQAADRRRDLRRQSAKRPLAPQPCPAHAAPTGKRILATSYRVGAGQRLFSPLPHTSRCSQYQTTTYGSQSTCVGLPCWVQFPYGVPGRQCEET